MKKAEGRRVDERNIALSVSLGATPSVVQELLEIKPGLALCKANAQPLSCCSVPPVWNF